MGGGGGGGGGGGVGGGQQPTGALTTPTSSMHTATLLTPVPSHTLHSAPPPSHPLPAHQCLVHVVLHIGKVLVGVKAANALTPQHLTQDTRERTIHSSHTTRDKSHDPHMTVTHGQFLFLSW